jgi:KRAB domain-containing zinc finger protein
LCQKSNSDFQIQSADIQLQSDSEEEAEDEEEEATNDILPQQNLQTSEISVNDEQFSIEFDESISKDFFTCPICHSIFSSSQDLAIHVVKNHQIPDDEKIENYPPQKPSTTTGNRKFVCNFCDKKFDSAWKLRRHFLVHKDLLDPSELPKFPPREYKHQCPECGKRVETPSKLQRHMSVHDKKNRLQGVNKHRPVACPDCPMRFWDKVKLDRHRFIHSEAFERTKIVHPPGHMFTCIICLTKLPTYDECNEHMKSHRDEMNENAQVHCRLCNRAYPKLANVIRHSKLHIENATNECTHCGKKFGFGDDFIDHMLRHEGFKPHACDFPGCKKSFMKTHKLKLHKATHDQNATKMYSCDKCPKSFKEIEHLKKHLFRHLGIKSFSCTLCPARFAVKSGLESHMTTHTNEKKFQCKICDSKFTKNQTLNMHMKIHKSEKAYACSFCDMRFIASGQLKRHVRTHTKERPYQVI